MKAKVHHFAEGATGTYRINNSNTFQHLTNGFRIIVGRSSRPNKPSKVLIFIDPETGLRKYISGLFYVNETDYCFDCAGKVYRLSIDDGNGTAEIYQCDTCSSIIHQWFKNHKSNI